MYSRLQSWPTGASELNRPKEGTSKDINPNNQPWNCHPTKWGTYSLLLARESESSENHGYAAVAH